MKTSDITACLVTRGDVDMEPILESLIFDEVIIWDNSKRHDWRVAGRYMATHHADTPFVYYQDDDVLVPSSTQRALMEHHEPGMMTAVYAHGLTPDGYDDLPLVPGGGIVDTDLPWRALNRYLHHFPIDDEFMYEADFIAGVLYPLFKHVRLPFDIMMERAQHPSRLCNQDFQKEMKFKATSQARSVRDGTV